MKYFGESWGAPVLEDLEQVEAPVGDLCSWCSEPIEENDQGIIYNNGPVSHDECFERTAVGGVYHLRKECSCFCTEDVAKDNDPEHLTKRQQAMAAVVENARIRAGITYTACDLCGEVQRTVALSGEGAFPRRVCSICFVQLIKE